jgi:membrane-associated phospholipid phosphatase
LTAPLHAGDFGATLQSRKFYLVMGGAGGVWGGSFALDQSMRAQLRGMSSGDANLLEDISVASISAASGTVYLYGLYAADARAREYMLTAGESAGIASLIVLGLKAGFGRLRPHENRHDHDAFFHGGSSFVSGEVTPMFSLAAGISEYYGNRWYVAAPIYGLALLDGFGRMGHDAHWFSDVIGAALLGVGMTELLLWTHRYHADHPWRLRIFPVAPPVTSPLRTSEFSTGVTVALDF